MQIYGRLSVSGSPKGRALERRSRPFLFPPTKALRLPFVTSSPCRALAVRTRLPMVGQWRALTAFIHHRTSSGSVSRFPGTTMPAAERTLGPARLLPFYGPSLPSSPHPHPSCSWGKCRPSNQKQFMSRSEGWPWASGKCRRPLEEKRGKKRWKLNEREILKNRGIKWLIGKEEALPRRSSYLWDGFGFRASTCWIIVMFSPGAGSRWPQIFSCKTVTCSTFCLLDGERSCREFLIYYAGCASPRLHSAACATILSQGPAELFTALVVYGTFFSKKIPKLLAASLCCVFGPLAQPQAPSLGLCNKTINTDACKMQPSTFGQAKSFARTANGNKIAPSAFFKMHGCVLGPFEYSRACLPQSSCSLLPLTRKHGRYTMRRRTLHLCTRYGFFSRISLWDEGFSNLYPLVREPHGDALKR